MHVRSRANDDLFAAPVDPCKPSFGLSGVREPYLNQSHTRITASIARANPSKTSANESKTSVRQVTRLPSSSLVAPVNESMASLIDALASASQLTCHENLPVTESDTITQPSQNQSNLRKRGGGGVGGAPGAGCPVRYPLSPVACPAGPPEENGYRRNLVCCSK